MNIKDVGEIGLIKRLTGGIKLSPSVVMGAGDDAAVIKWKPGKYLLYTSDMTIEGTHFKKSSATPSQIGWKALCRNISDIAAMGGVPLYAVVSIALPPSLDVSFAGGIYEGIKKAARRYKVDIVGGDTSRSDSIIIDISLIGEVEKTNLVTRRGARRGDIILVTGSIGGSLNGKHLDFLPRVKESRALVKKYSVSSMIDVTDGLLLDLRRILDSSGAGARIYKEMVPLSEGASFEKAVREGEDFELLFTMSRKEARRFFTGGMLKDTPVTPIGEITGRSCGYRLLSGDGKSERIRAGGYLHF